MTDVFRTQKHIIDDSKALSRHESISKRELLLTINVHYNFEVISNREDNDYFVAGKIEFGVNSSYSKRGFKMRAFARTGFNFQN